MLPRIIKSALLRDWTEQSLIVDRTNVVLVSGKQESQKSNCFVHCNINLKSPWLRHGSWQISSTFVIRVKLSLVRWSMPQVRLGAGVGTDAWLRAFDLDIGFQNQGSARNKLK